MAVIARLHNNGKLGIAGEVVEIPPELVGGRNLMPKFSAKWSRNPKHVIINDYEVQNTDSTQPGLSYILLDVEPNTDYTLSADSDFYTAIFTEDASKAIGGGYAPFPKTFNTGTYAKIRVYLRSDQAYGTYVRELKLEKGTQKTSWQPSPEDLGYSLPGWIHNFDNPLQFHSGGLATKLLVEIPVELTGGRNLLLNSAKEVTGTREFVQYADLAPIFNKYGLREYTISFDIKSKNITNRNVMQVYSQNGSGAKYSIGNVNVPVTTEYQRQSVTVTPTIQNASLTQSMLAFYGNYDTGNIPIVKNVKVELGPKKTQWQLAAEDLGYSLPDWVQNFDGVQLNPKGVAMKELEEGVAF
ncbi:hypothetical protein FZD47_02525 [Bacillus infantis]|uniref:Uncharacterized protein n=1 Tax=Bacillus infantis TaxID=324767 RepID=A0A5D4SUH8_9BACI|nr:hypothetical protein [Bacillus infantis]TYS66381.1 hypothetical protein FZD47_02525 [Bacillus infantis]